MTTYPLQQHTPEVTIHDGKAITTSFAISEYFHKRHDDVLKKIRSVIDDCEPDYHARNFAVCHKNSELQNGKPQPYFELTRDAFVLIVMGFTGKKALQWKIDYINAFNMMEAELREFAATPTALPAQDDHANRTEVIYYQDFKPIFCRTLTKGEIVISHESMLQWLEKKGLIFFTRNELKNLSYSEWLKATSE